MFIFKIFKIIFNSIIFIYYILFLYYISYFKIFLMNLNIFKIFEKKIITFKVFLRWRPNTTGQEMVFDHHQRLFRRLITASDIKRIHWLPNVKRELKLNGPAPSGCLLSSGRPVRKQFK